jgi:hypothetical protein
VGTRPLLFVFFTSWPWGEQFCPAAPSYHGVLPLHRPKDQPGPSDHRLKPLKPWANINIFSGKLIISDIFTVRESQLTEKFNII